MNPFYHQTARYVEGSLHSLEYEHDNCGMGAVIDIKGNKSHRIVEMAITSVCNMIHRGAVDADMKTGDGSGILSQIPFELFAKHLAAQNISINAEELAVGVFFLEKNNQQLAETIQTRAEQVATRRGMQVLGWREVPVNADALGKIARESQPNIQHLLLKKPAHWENLEYERNLYLMRRELELWIKKEQISGAYIPSLSSRLISYKALVMPTVLSQFYTDLVDEDFTTAICLFHQRFSTNTFPAWPLAQPFRMLCHNGEINTIKGNRNWMASREEMYASPIWADEIDLVKDLLSDKESDSASLDHALELLVMSGRSLEHAMCMLVPPAYRNDMEISDSLRAFYQYHRSFSEPWDGPAGLVYTDGISVCASLDRNGLRPSRYTMTNDGLLIIGSESGAIVLDEANVNSRGRLGPGQMLSVNTQTGELLFDSQIKERLAQQAPYRTWVDENRWDLSDFVSNEPIAPAEDFDALTLSRWQVAQGITQEDLDMIFPPMYKTSQEAVYSMGDDIPLAVLSDYPRNLSSYFRQLFAQVTNPPIDPIREWAVMSYSASLGVERNFLGETPDHAKVLNLESAVLLEQEIEKIKKLSSHGFKSQVIDCTWPVSAGTAGLLQALESVCQQAEQAVDEGYNVLILSDRNISEQRVAIPVLIYAGGIHLHLTRKRKRMRASLVVESAEVRDTHQLATVFGYGITAVCPYLGYATCRALAAGDKEGKTSAVKAMSNYRKALEKGVLKIMSKMGISVLNSYQGAQIFEIVGLGQEVVSRCFEGTPSKLGGIGFEEIAEDSLRRHEAAWQQYVPPTGKLDLGDPGYNRYRKNAERHALTTEVIKEFHAFVKTNDKSKYDDYVKATTENLPLCIKDLFEFVPLAGGPISIDEVEPKESIFKRFTTAAMSMGAISPEAHETLAIAMNRIGAKSDSGEGGEDPLRYQPYPNGDNAISRIKQVASGRFGVTAEYLVNCEEIEIKMAQGAKPGEGGQLPGHKVNALIARLRRTQPGVQLISPPPHHDIYSIEDLAQLIHDLKEINPKAKITVKLVAERGVGTIAAGVAKAAADIILISGHDGGTGASPLSSIKHAGLPWELGLAETQQTLVLNNLRGRVTLRTDGGLRNGRDIVIGAILGAEEFNFGTIALVAMGCVYVRKCHLNNCPVGIATQDPKFRAKFKGTPEMVVNFFHAVAEETREIMASLGIRKLDDLIGRPELLKQKHFAGVKKANMLNLAPMLVDIAKQRGDENAARRCNTPRNMAIEKPALDIHILESAQEHIDNATSFKQTYTVVNTDRNIGTRLSGRVAERWGDKGLKAGTIDITCIGTAGESFGCFLAGGVKLSLQGEANDYVGKGMAEGEIIIHPGQAAKFAPEDNSIMGNTVMYGATGGKLYANGRSGERFAVRNSGATAVVEGCGDHGCEYMTNGTVVILGPTGKNFGAGMSGGVAYVLDEDGLFHSRLNDEMVVDLPIKRPQDIVEAKKLISEHAAKTGSPKAKRLLENWEATVSTLVRVIPKERAELEAAEEQHEAASVPVGK